MFRLVVCCLVLGGCLARPRGPVEPEPRGPVEPEPRAEEDQLLHSDLLLPFLNGSSQSDSLSAFKDLRSLTPMVSSDAAGRATNTYVVDPGYYTLKTGNYPSNYPHNVDETVVVTGKLGQQISIRCPKIDIEYHSTCGKDYLIVNGNKICGTSKKLNTIWAARIESRFHSDGSTSAKGVFCRFEVPDVPSGGQCCGIANRQTRIVGGQETSVNEYPWQVALVTSGNNRPFCGGTIINNRYVLTAAHCTTSFSAGSLNVLLRKHNLDSDSNQIRISVSQKIEHPSYGSGSRYAYDFALLRLSQTINFSSYNNKVAPACLPTGGSFDWAVAVTSGWGHTTSGGSHPSQIRDVTVMTMSNAKCSQRYSNIHSSMICAAETGKDACQGDSGGPLVSLVNGRYNLIGVVSWGYGCASSYYPGVYSRVTVVSSWIQQNTAGASLC